MDYSPRYPQPFTLREASGLDATTVTDEIARLQDSLQRLHETQKALREYDGEPDEEIDKAVQENETTIGSQTERISMLRMVLENKGIVVAGSHYDLHTEPSSRAVAGVHGNGLSDADDQPQRDSVEDPVDDGLHL